MRSEVVWQGVSRLHMSDQCNNYDNQIKLYGMIVDQIHKYATIFWQFPMAFVVANILAFDKLQNNAIILTVIAVFDCVMVYSFQEMVGHSRSLIAATQKAEAVLKEKYEDFVPTFRVSKVKATKMAVIAMWIIPIGLYIYVFVYVFLSISRS